MIPIATRTGRPFVEMFARVVCQPNYARHAVRGRTDAERVVWVTWLGCTRPVPLDLCASRQRLGGVRWWFRCPRCQERRRVLLVGEQPDVIACRTCCRAVYMTNFPGRRWHLALRQCLGTTPGGPLDVSMEFDRLAARKRRGVRRGRRVQERALRLGQVLVRAPWGDRLGEYWDARGRR